jgi:hypothetical protein
VGAKALTGRGALLVAALASVLLAGACTSNAGVAVGVLADLLHPTRRVGFVGIRTHPDQPGLAISIAHTRLYCAAGSSQDQ